MSWKIPRALFSVVLFLGIATVAFAADASKWQAEWQKTIEAAKKEAQVSLYGGQEITHPDIVAAFHKNFRSSKSRRPAGVAEVGGPDHCGQSKKIRTRKIEIGKRIPRRR